jgi:hypothetical protein
VLFRSSADGGVTWNPVETGIAGTSYNLTLTGFSGGNEYVVKVITSDGMHSAEDTSDGFFTIASFTIKTLTTPQIVAAGTDANYTYVLQSYGGFSGTIKMNARSSTSRSLTFDWVTGSTIVLAPYEQREAILQIGVANVTEGGNHTILVSGSDGTNTETTIAYLFAISGGDETPPVIVSVHQEPEGSLILAGQQVTVGATVIDQFSGVSRVTLEYQTDTSGWILIEMTKSQNDSWTAVIPSFPDRTNVTYLVSAEDGSGNTITTATMGYRYQYYVITEFQPIVLLILIAVASVALIIMKSRVKKTSARTMCGSKRGL